MISVFLENQHVKAQVGWFAEERKGRVDLWISVMATLKPKKVHEDLTRTLDYASLVRIVITESAKERKLLETLADDIIQALDADHPGILATAEVSIRKKKLALNGFNADSVGIKFFRQF